MLDVQDTIVAISSAPGFGMRGILRISGPDTRACIESLSADGEPILPLPNHRAARFEASIDCQLGSVPADIYFWPNAKSYTRQPSAELHLSASDPILKSVLELVCRQGARLAQPGEFTLRSFLAGRIDLTQAEAVLGVIDANSEDDLQIALNQLAGNLAEPIQRLRDQLIEILADVEAELDFVEEDIEFVEKAHLQSSLRQAREHVQSIMEQIHGRSFIESVPKVVLKGPSNAGKSSLFNALVGQRTAIVSANQGTTRDYLTARLQVDSFEFDLIDTAGILDSSSEPVDSIDQLARNQATYIAGIADLQLFCIDQNCLKETIDEAPLASDDFLLVLTKTDLPCDPGLVAFFEDTLGPGRLEQALETSVESDIGIDQLKSEIVVRLMGQTSQQLVAATLTRCANSLHGAAEAIERAESMVDSHRELLAADLRAALNLLGEVVGVVYTDDILDRVFGKFCIGK